MRGGNVRSGAMRTDSRGPSLSASATARPRLAPMAGLVVAALVLAAPAGSAEAQRRRRDRERDRTEEAAAPVGTTGTLSFTGDYEGAEVLIDEHFIGTMPLDPLPVDAGSHTVRVRLPGYSEYTDVVTVVAGQATEVWIDMLALSEALTVITTPPGAHVFVDGTFLGDTPTDVDLREGERVLRLVLPGYEEVTRTVTAVAGANDLLSVELVPIPEDDGEQWYESPVTWGAIGGGVAAVVLVVVIAAVATSSSGTQLDQFCAGGMQPCIRVSVAF